MNSKLIAVCVGASGVGALFSWAITADYYSRRLAEAQVQIDWAQEDNEELREKLAYEQAQKLMRVPDEEPEDDDHPQLPFDSDEAVITTDVETPETPQETEERLRRTIQEYVQDPDIVDDFVMMTRGPEDERFTPPFVISNNEYAWSDEGDEYAKIALTYYSQLELLVDEDEILIPDIDGVVGVQNLNRFGSESNHPEVVYIRNRRLRTDFEVGREDVEDPPIHIRYGMGKEEFAVEKAAGNIAIREVEQ